MNNEKDLFVILFTIFCIIIMGIRLQLNGEEVGKVEMIQELCEKQTYDFCKQEKVIYKLKENKNE